MINCADELINSIVDATSDIEEIDKQWSEECHQMQGRMLEMELMSKTNTRDEEKETKTPGEKEKTKIKNQLKNKNIQHKH